MGQVLIITGGYLNIEFARQYTKTLSFDKVFAVDKGLEYADAIGIMPDFIVGDFDTVSKTLLETYEKRIEREQLHTKIERHPAKKDASDTELALQQAISERAEQITILGATGSRLDHVLANINLLIQSEKAGVPCYLVDETNRIQLLTSPGRHTCILEKKNQHGRYLSVIPFTDRVSGVTLQGVAYPLKDRDLARESSLTVSNEIIDEKAYITLENGKMLVIESKDQ